MEAFLIRNLLPHLVVSRFPKRYGSKVVILCARELDSLAAGFRSSLGKFRMSGSCRTLVISRAGQGYPPDGIHEVTVPTLVWQSRNVESIGMGGPKGISFRFSDWIMTRQLPRTSLSRFHQLHRLQEDPQDVAFGNGTLWQQWQNCQSSLSG